MIFIQVFEMKDTSRDFGKLSTEEKEYYFVNENVIYKFRVIFVQCLTCKIYHVTLENWAQVSNMKIKYEVNKGR